MADAAKAQVRHLDTDGLRERILDHPEDPRWGEVAKRCLACTNCTLVCPTCFCTTVVDEGDLSGDTFRRRQLSASCFTASFTYMHGGSVRRSIKSRYRHWLTHKLATWVDQFGEIGCVGCGRCITWCPVGIDLTEEAAAIGRHPHAEPVASGASGAKPEASSREGGAS
jgi:Fe-S-cluster-containing hydrogenase component 2